MPHSDVDSTKATAHLPGLDIEIVHRPSPDGFGEQISINFTAVPSFEAFSHFMDAFNPVAFWAEAMRLVWFPWLQATRAVMLPPGLLPPPSNDRRDHPFGRDLIRETD
jgi:hypothetical protein